MDIIELLKVILIGIVEGITEWLPISSTGHMLLLDDLIALQMSEAFKEMFFVVIQWVPFWRWWPCSGTRCGLPPPGEACHPKGYLFHVVQGGRGLHPGGCAGHFV